MSRRSQPFRRFPRLAPWIAGACLVAGVESNAVASPPKEAEESSGPPRVRIEPRIPVVPANHLKFYLHFSEPMERGDVFRHFRLVEVDEQGHGLKEVPEPFREVELWDETFTRLTLWFHPGRQKPGVNLNLELGPILEPGRHYRLEISGEWRTENGKGLGQLFSHPFTAGEPDLESPDPTRWVIHLPEAKRDLGKGIARSLPRAVVLATGESLDPITAASSISVRRDGLPFPLVVERIAGNIPFTEGNPNHLNFALLPAPSSSTKLAPWPPGNYEIVILPRLEDLAGNSLARPFNLDLDAQPDFKERTEPVILPFTLPSTP